MVLAMLKVELHTHTADDPADRIPYTTRDLIDRVAALNYDALAVTLHDRQLDLRPHEDYAAERGIVLIPGIERTIEGKHVLLVNFSRAAETVTTFADLAHLRRDEPGLVIAPHPFFPGRTCLGYMIDCYAELFDAVEWNAMFTRHVNFNTRAAEWGHRHDKPLVGNGDIHRLSQLGSCYSLVEAAAEPHAICSAIREKRITVKAKPLSAWSAARTMGGLLGDDLTEKMGSRFRPARRLIDSPAPDLP